MKPETLRIQNIGPFAGNHIIDFTKLDSIFLVCGKTGAGKTTIFDALSYAFYSKPLGSRAGIARSLKSHFANQNSIAETELIFWLGEKRYKILRRLPALKEGKKNESPEEVSLSEWLNNTWEDRSSTNKSETDKKIRSIIRLSEKEFSRIVLLPQNAFAEFLKENSNQKKEMLAELFPVSAYTNIMEKAKEKEKKLKLELKLAEEQLQNLASIFNAQTFETQKEQIETEITLIKKNYETYTAQRDKKNAELQKSHILKAKREEFNKVDKELKSLCSKENIINSLKQKLKNARKVSSTAGKIEMLKNINTDIVQTISGLKNAEAELEEVKNSLQKLNKEEKKIEDEKIQSEKLRRSIEKLELAVHLAKEIESCTIKYKHTKKEISSIEENLKQCSLNSKDALDKINTASSDIKLLEERSLVYENLRQKLEYQKQVKNIAEKTEELQELYQIHCSAAEKLETELKICEQDIIIEQNELKTFQAEKKIAEQNAAAAILAAELKENSPCPVCGSTEHPKPAVNSDSSFFTIEEKIAKTERSLENFFNKRTGLHQTLAKQKADSESCINRISENTTYFAELNSQYIKPEQFTFETLPAKDKIKITISETAKETEKAASAFRKSQTAHNLKISLEKSLNTIQIEEKKLQDSLNTEKIKEAAFKTALDEKQKQYAAAFDNLDDEFTHLNPESAVDKCKNRILVLDRNINAYFQQKGEYEVKKTKLETYTVSKNEQLLDLKKKQQELELNLTGQIEELGFNNLQELLSAALDESEIASIENDIKNFEREKTILIERFENLEKELKNEPEIFPELIENELEALKNKLEKENIRFNQYTVELEQLKKNNEHYKTLSKEREEKARSAYSITKLSAVLNGDNACKLKFDIWVLSAFLHEIVIYANKRLEEMSSGRYTLKVAEKAVGHSLAGLDLEIFDSYTGTNRPSASLSGGETFMAAVSLALGLADSIQAGNGGIQLESMFIDEGFGSLDESSLDKAITILDSIRGNRMVGIISHVNELKNRIPSKLEIEKTAKGSYIKDISG